MKRAASPETAPSKLRRLDRDVFVSVTDYNDAVRVHLRHFATDDGGSLRPTRKGVTLTPFVWQSLAAEMDFIGLPSPTGEIAIVRNSLMLSSAYIDEQPYVVLQKFFQRKDFSRQFFPDVMLLTQSEWDLLKELTDHVNRQVSDLQFTVFRRLVLREAAVRAPSAVFSGNMCVPEMERVLVMSLTDVLKAAVISTGHDVSMALSLIDFKKLSADFIEKNVQIVNYITEEFLGKIDFKNLVNNLS